VLPNLLKRRARERQFRILCAGVSTGQEAYSLAMIVRDHGWELSGWGIQIVGLDISRSALSVAQLATYSQFDVQRGLPVRTLLKHFSKREEAWILNGDVQGLVGFVPGNLLDDLQALGRFDVVLCRNVLTYFDLQTKFTILQRIARSLADDGLLYLSLDESVSGMSSAYRPIDVALGIHTVHRGDKTAAQSLAN
jgi:chemotaxis protein methyltransferase CheR